MVNVVAEKGTALAQEGQAKAQQLSSQASEAARNVGQRGQEMAGQGKQAAVDATQQVQNTSANVARRGGDLAQSGKETVFDLSNQAKQTASNVSDSVSDDVARPLGKDTNPFRNDLDVTDTSSSRTDLYSNDSNGNAGNYTHGGRDEFYQNVGEVDSGIMNRGPPLSHRTFETPRQVAPPVPARKPASYPDPAFQNEGNSVATHQ